jgi:hypothetical protein
VLGPLRADDVVEPRQLATQNLSIEEKQRAQSLVLRGRRELIANGERRQERGDLDGAHLGWVTLAVKEDVAPDPVNVGLLGAAAVVPGADAVADAVEEAGRARAGLGTSRTTAEAAVAHPFGVGYVMRRACSAGTILEPSMVRPGREHTASTGEPATTICGLRG